MIPKNFHKLHFPIEFQRYCLGDEKLNFILKEMYDNHDIEKGKLLLLPFGGPGSATNFFDFHKISTVSGDIEYWRKYKHPYKQLTEFRKKYDYIGVQQKFIAWDVMNLSSTKNKFQLALVNPPFGVECKIETCAIKFAVDSFFEILHIMDRESVVYYVIPKNWVNDFLFMTKIISKCKFIKKKLSSDPNSNFPLSLLRIEISKEQVTF